MLYKFKKGVFMVIFNKKSQAMSTEVYIAITVFLSAIVLFYSLFVYMDVDNVSKREFELTIEKIKTNQILGQEMMTYYDEEYLFLKNCNELKDYFQIRNDFCIFFVNSDNKIISVGNLTHFKYGIGCDGVVFNKTGQTFNCGVIYPRD
jgi:hypothetical protein